jgi:AcrR family transcriptional regulator
VYAATDSAGSGRIVKRGRPSVAEAQRLPDQILDAGWQVLLDEGFEGFTFDRLARHARVGKATIYSRFANKRAFLLALVNYYMANRRAEIHEQARGLPMIEAMASLAAQMLDLLFSRDGILFDRLIDWLDQEGGANDSVVRRESYARAIETIERALICAAERGETTIDDVPRVARFWVEGMIGHARLAGSQGHKSPEDNARWARDYAEFFFNERG